MEEPQGLTKQQKKRQRKAAKTLIAKIKLEKEEKDHLQCETDPLVALKTKFAEAKEKGDIELVQKLRQDIWILQDASAGHKPDLPLGEVSSSLERITASLGEKNQENSNTASVLTPSEKRLRNLKKKLQQIEVLKDRKRNGEILELTQVAKMDTEAAIRKEIEELERGN